MSRISVIIPCLNDAAYIRQALESVFAQTRLPDEVIVVNGGSTDGTLEILAEYGERVAVFRQEGKGVSRAKNQAARRATGDYLSFLDADDFWYPEKLLRQEKLMESHTEYGFCSSDVDFFNEDGVLIHAAISKEKQPRSGEVFPDLFRNNFISSATVFLRKSCFEASGGFPEETYYAEDTELWLRMAKSFQLGYIPEALAAYRVREDSRSQQFNLHYASVESIHSRLAAEHPEYFQAHPELLSQARYNLYVRWGWRNFDIGLCRQARRQYARALRIYPWKLVPWKYVLLSLLPGCFLKSLRGLIGRKG